MCNQQIEKQTSLNVKNARQKLHMKISSKTEHPVDYFLRLQVVFERTGYTLPNSQSGSRVILPLRYGQQRPKGLLS